MALAAPTPDGLLGGVVDAVAPITAGLGTTVNGLTGFGQNEGGHRDEGHGEIKLPIGNNYGHNLESNYGNGGFGNNGYNGGGYQGHGNGPEHIGNGGYNAVAPEHYGNGGGYRSNGPEGFGNGGYGH
ncbi:hypothetical protein LPJ75_006483, partial [Coemansia sp. RSA 2598]